MANINQHFLVNHTSLPLVQLPAKVVEKSARSERAGSDLRTQVTCGHKSLPLCATAEPWGPFVCLESYCVVRVLEK